MALESLWNSKSAHFQLDLFIYIYILLHHFSPRWRMVRKNCCWGSQAIRLNERVSSLVKTETRDLWAKFLPATITILTGEHKQELDVCWKVKIQPENERRARNNVSVPHMVSVQGFRSPCFYLKPEETGTIADDVYRMSVLSPLHSTNSISKLVSCQSRENWAKPT